LRVAVEELLKTQADAEQFFAEGASSLTPLIDELESAAAPAQDGAAFEEAPGTMLGRYKVIEKIGEGGFGVVYMAEQEQPVRRRVALKVIKLGMDTKSVIARFEAERQALAMMEHPNIARVFDAGATETGRPYFVMELVRGVKVTDYCDRNQLGMEQRLELFIQICQAIQHAHQKGIIHRDIKPTNILVTLHDGVPMPKVIDFGIAKATEERLTDKTLFTACAQWIGTPAYMSPEQMALSGLDLDTRSDIYSLGVLLYELLTGETPFDTKELLKSGVEEMRRTLREREPTTPSAKLHTLSGKELETTAARRDVDPARLVSQVRGDLDWIVMKALEKDRSRRYETANAMAMDIRRYLEDEPVLARPPSRWYLLQKLVRRNRLAFASGAAVAAALLIGTVTSTRLYLQERDAQRRVVAAQREVESHREAEMEGKVAQAALLLAKNQYHEADKIMAGVTVNRPSVDAAKMFRAMGDFHALSGRWPQAVERLAMLPKADQLDNPDVGTLDYLRLGTTLVRSGDLNGYEHFRQEAIGRFGGVGNPLAERVIKFTLLLPTNQQMIQNLLPQAQAVEKALTTARDGAKRVSYEEGWQSLALALFEYRRGDYAKATKWSRRSLDFPEYIAPRSAAANAILAMSSWQMNQKEEAMSAWIQSREMIEGRFKPKPGLKTGPNAYWFDPEIGRILLRECEERFEEADRSMAQFSVRKPSMEGAAMFRALGQWHVLRGEMREAADRFGSLVKVDLRDDWEAATLDYLAGSSTMAELRETAAYEQMRAEAIARFKGMDNKVVAERIIKISLLAPADEKILAELVPQAEVAVRPFTSADGDLKENASFDAWNSMTLGLLEYRRGNYTKAADWCRRSLASVDNVPLPSPTARLVLAMALHQLGQDEAARSELQQARDVIEDRFKTGLDQYRWRDWLFGRVLLREATELLGVPAK
jgi:hypothetical protein